MQIRDLVKILLITSTVVANVVYVTAENQVGLDDYEELLGKTFSENFETESSMSGEEDSDSRSGKLLWSHPQSPLIEFVRKSVAENYVPKNTGDLFDFLRDPYPLPRGKPFLLSLF